MSKNKTFLRSPHLASLHRHLLLISFFVLVLCIMLFSFCYLHVILYSELSNTCQILLRLTYHSVVINTLVLYTEIKIYTFLSICVFITTLNSLILHYLTQLVIVNMTPYCLPKTVLP